MAYNDRDFRNSYWRSGWANKNVLPGTKAAMMNGGRYQAWNAIADILGAVIQANDMKARAKANQILMDPVKVNTSDVVSTPEFKGMDIGSTVAERYAQQANPQGGGAQDLQRMGMPGAAQAMQGFEAMNPQFGSDAWQRQNVVPQGAAPAQQAPEGPAAMPVQQAAPQVSMTPQEVEYQKNLREHPEWFDLNGNYIGNTYTMYDGVSDSNLTPLTMRKLNLLSNAFKNQWGEPLGVTSMRRHGDGSSWHDSGQAFDVAGGLLETNPEARAWAVEQAAKYGLVPLDEYANPSPHATGGHLHFSDHGDELSTNYQQAGQPTGQQGGPQAGQTIRAPQTQQYVPPERQLHQATPEQPWTDTLNTREKVMGEYDRQWAAKMKEIEKVYPGLLSDPEAMREIMAMREQGRQNVLGEWGKTETRRNWENFQRAGSPQEKLYYAIQNGLDLNQAKMLMTPEWENTFANFGGEMRMVSKNKYTGDVLVNGHEMTQDDLRMTMTPAQEQQIAMQRERLEMERERLNLAKEKAAAGGGGRSGGGSGAGSRSRTSAEEKSANDKKKHWDNIRYFLETGKGEAAATKSEYILRNEHGATDDDFLMVQRAVNQAKRR